jgi:dihydroorotate dehydrogenase
MIELAPNHKFGLPIHHPLMPAAGFFGYGLSAYQPVIQADLFGAIVTNPITLRPQYHQNSPQIMEVSGGVIFNPSPGNPGVRKVIRQSHKEWLRSPIPIIAHLPADDPSNLARTAGALDGLEAVAGFELGLPPESRPTEIKTWVEAILQRSELPVLVKLPFPPSLTLAETILQAGGDGLVIAAAPPGAAYAKNQTLLRGAYYGGGVATRLLPFIIDLRVNLPQTPIVASGGVHSPSDVKGYLQAGANAVQIDTLIFIDPAQVQQILLTFVEVSAT